MSEKMDFYLNSHILFKIKGWAEKNYTISSEDFHVTILINLFIKKFLTIKTDYSYMLKNVEQKNKDWVVESTRQTVENSEEFPTIWQFQTTIRRFF